MGKNKLGVKCKAHWDIAALGSSLVATPKCIRCLSKVGFESISAANSAGIDCTQELHSQISPGFAVSTNQLLDVNCKPLSAGIFLGGGTWQLVFNCDSKGRKQRIGSALSIISFEVGCQVIDS